MGSNDQNGTPRVLTGERVRLRPLEDEDAILLQMWSEDPGLRRLTGEVSPMSQAETEAFLEKARNDEAREWFAVTIREDGRVIGEAGLLRKFPPWRTVDVSVIIGEADERGKGYGTEAVLLLLDLAFRDLGYHRVAIGVVGFNEQALRFWSRVGFRQEGVQRDGYLYDGQYHDFIMMSMLDKDYQDLHGGCEQ